MSKTRRIVKRTDRAHVKGEVWTCAEWLGDQRPHHVCLIHTVRGEHARVKRWIARGDRLSVKTWEVKVANLYRYEDVQNG